MRETKEQRSSYYHLRRSLLLHIFVLPHFFGVLASKRPVNSMLWGDFHLFINHVNKIGDSAHDR
jgi:hypothetical protein